MATRTLKESYNINKKDIFNMMSAQTLESVKGQQLVIVGCATGEDVSIDSGEVVDTGYLKDSEGNLYSTISKTAIQAISNLVDILADEELDGEAVIKVESRKSNGGRDFIVLTLV